MLRPLTSLAALVFLASSASAQPGDSTPKDAETARLDAAVRKLGGKLERLAWPKDRIELFVDLSGTGTTDADLTQFSQAQAVVALNLSFTRITNNGLASLTGLKGLRTLTLTGTKITDDGVDFLRRLSSLSSLDICQTGVTDDGVFQLVKGKYLTLARVGLGEKAHYRVHQEFADGKLVYCYLMIGDCYFGRYYPGLARAGQGMPLQDLRREATTYYHRHGPVGAVMRRLEWFQPTGLLDYPSDVRLPTSFLGLMSSPGSLPVNALAALWSEPPIGVVRLNVGTHAAYGRPFQPIHFYDSTPEIHSFSVPPMGQPIYFGYVHDAQKRGCSIQVIDGPERASITKKAPQAFYQAMFVDIARNDLRDVNTDLLTKEAVADMMKCLTETGILCFHTSHRYHDFVRPIVDAAAALNLSWKVGHDIGGARTQASSHFSSQWVVIARQAAHLQDLTDSKIDDWKLEWSTPLSTGANLWRDGQPANLKGIERAPVR